MNKILKRLLTGVLTLATVFTALPTTAVHAAEGTHNELMKKKGVYQKLYHIQQESLGWTI